MKTTYTLYKVQFGTATYFTTDIITLIEFCYMFGVNGHADEHGEVYYQVPNLVAQHPEGTFKKIKKQYFN